MIPPSSEILFVRRCRKFTRFEMHVIVAVVLVGLLTAALLALLLIIDAAKHPN